MRILGVQKTMRACLSLGNAPNRTEIVTKSVNQILRQMYSDGNHHTGTQTHHCNVSACGQGNECPGKDATATGFQDGVGHQTLRAETAGVKRRWLTAHYTKCEPNRGKEKVFAKRTAIRAQQDVPKH